jgi:hypothetical protein
MAQRKQTPDVLAEVLGGITPPVTNLPLPQKRETKKSSRPATPEKRAVSSRSWEYRVVSFQEYKGWRLRFTNGVELRNWMGAPLIHEYIAQLSQEGWELITACSGECLYGNADKYQLYFRRVMKA